MLLRPIRPDDGERHLAFLGKLAPEDIRMRVFSSRRSIAPTELARLTQIDYEREMAFIATWHPDDEHATEETLGVARALVDPDNVEAEFGILVRSDLKAAGLGRRLMDKLIAFLRARGTQRLVATVLHENHRMLALAESLGLQPSARQPDAESMRLEMELAPPA
jgi:acetyltransferase